MSDSIEQGLERLETVFARLRSEGLKLKPSKCDLLRQSVHFLGHVVDHDGIHTDPAKVEKIANWPIPTDVSGVRSFLGLASYYRKFVRNFAKIAAPLHNLTKIDVTFIWSEDIQVSFDALKKASD